MPDYAYFVSVGPGSTDGPEALRTEQVEVVRVSPKLIEIRFGCFGSRHRTRIPAEEWCKTPAEAVEAYRRRQMSLVAEAQKVLDREKARLDLLSQLPLPAIIPVTEW